MLVTKNLRDFFSNLFTKGPVVYSLLLILLVPLALIANTLWNLRTFERDMDFAIREQAIILQKTINSLFSANNDTQNQEFTQTLVNLQDQVPQLVSISILELAANNDFQPVMQTNQAFSAGDAENFLNSLAWSKNQAFFIESTDPNLPNNLWILVAPLTDATGEKVALLNLKINSERVDSVIGRTSRDALIILGASVVIIVLLLLNHLRMFEKSLEVNKLKEIDQMKDNFISVASHELRTPLVAIHGYIDLLEKDLRAQMTPNRQKKINILRASADRLGKLVEDILNVSRIEQNRLDFSVQSTDVLPIVNEVVTDLVPNAEQKGLRLTIAAPGALPPIMVNIERLEEVLTNLIGNAIKYTAKGEVNVALVVGENQTMSMMVKDTGFGIAPEDQEKLFQKFSRIKTEQTQDIAGTGLGLWITKEMVEKMGGKIFVDSVVGQGSVFTVMFPIARE